MIVQRCFEGDDLKLALRQEDVYHEALHIITEGCRQHLVSACHMLDIPFERRWPAHPVFDHRTFQAAHDLVAAAWRHNVHPPEPLLLPLGPAGPDTMSDWLAWLRRDVARWIMTPDLVRAVALIANNQNNDTGYTAEDDLRRLLLERYDHIDWLRAR